jgi:hypothetical protein
LKIELDKLNVDFCQYSLSGDLTSDSIVLINNYDRWEFFYIDDYGNRDNIKEFGSESEACIYIYELLKIAKETEIRFGISKRGVV